MSRDHDERAAELLGDFEQRRRAGEFADPADLVARHPDLADELRTGLEAARRLGRPTLDADGASRPHAPERIGEFRVLREIGRGGMGVVYEAEQATMRRHVALKVLYPSITNTAKTVERFQREARAAGTLKHTNIVTVHQLGEDQGTWFCAMELVEGHSLDKVIEDVRRLRKPAKRGSAKRTPDSESGAASAWRATTGERRYFQRVAEMFAEIADALQLAHEHGVVHRDVKPANLMVSADGQLKILDFGLARIREEPTGLTVTGGVLGTPAYMSPEQARAGPVDARSDVWSLGATLYEVLTLRPPFHARNAAEILQKLRSEDARPPARLDRRIPRDLETIVMKALEKEPSKRYATAADMVKDLRAFAEGRTIAARHVGPLARAWRTAKRNKVRTGLAAGLLVATGAAVALVAVESRERARRIEFEYADLLARADAPWTTGEGEEREETESSRTEMIARAIALAPERPDGYLQRALLGRKATDVDAALSDLDSARSRGLSSSTTRLARAFVLRWGGRRTEALKEEALVEGDDPSDAGSLTLRAACAELEGRTDESLRLLDRALKAGNSNRVWTDLALTTRIRLRERSGDLEGALADLLAMRAVRGPGSASMSVEVRIARVWEKLGRPRAADDLVDELIAAADRIGTLERWTSLCGALARLSGQACEDGSGDKDIDRWLLAATDRALAQCPDAPSILLDKASASSPRDALDLCDRVIAKNPTMHEAYCDKASVLGSLGRLDESGAAALRAKETRPACPVAWASLGDAYSRTGKLDEAFAAFEESLRLDPLSVDAACNYAVALLGVKRPNDALAVLERGLAANPIHARLQRNRALILALVGRRADAVSAAETAVCLDPRDASSYGLLSGALIDIDRFADAEKAARRFVELSHDGCCSGLSLAQVLRREGRPAEALDALAKDPLLAARDPAALSEHALTLEAAGRHEESLADAEELTRLRPRYGWAYELRGLDLLNLLRKPDEAVSSLRQALALAEAEFGDEVIQPNGDVRVCRLFPVDEAVTRAALARAYQRAGRDAECVSECDRCLLKTPGNAAVLCTRATAFVDLRRFDDARADLEKGLASAPDDSQLHAEMGSLLDRTNRIDEALRETRRAVELDADNVEARSNLAVLLLQTGHPTEALPEADRCIEKRPRDVNLVVSRAAILRELRRYDDERECIEKALTWAPDDARLHMVLGEAFTFLNRLDESVAALRRASSLDPRNAVIRYNLGLGLLRSRHDADALLEFEWCLRTNPNNGDARWSRAAALANLGRPEEARQDYALASKLLPNEVRLHTDFANLLVAMNRLDEALVEYGRAADLDPKDSESRNALAWMLATSTDPKRRDAARAVKLAREAVDLAPAAAKGGIWNTLGVALCEDGQWQESLDALQKSMDLRDGGDAADWFFVAISHKRLGHADDARKWFDKAVAWTKEHAAGDEELARFQREAAEALGIAIEVPKAPAPGK